MQNNNQSQIFTELHQLLLKTDDEQEVKDFVIDNFEKFPKEFQQEVTASLFQESLNGMLQEAVKKYQKSARDLTTVYRASEKVLKQGLEEMKKQEPPKESA